MARPAEYNFLEYYRIDCVPEPLDDWFVEQPRQLTVQIALNDTRVQKKQRKITRHTTVPHCRRDASDSTCLR